MNEPTPRTDALRAAAQRGCLDFGDALDGAEKLERALEYISNTGGSPNITQFDEDHEPIGPMLREQLKDAQLVYEREGRIHECPSNANITDAGTSAPQQLES